MAALPTISSYDTMEIESVEQFVHQEWGLPTLSYSAGHYY